MINITIPFPLLPYLKFDFSEIPVTMTFFLIGPQYALLSTAIYWILLTIRAGDILGPAMKGAAVASMIIGLWVSSKVTKGNKTKGVKSLITSGLAIGGLLRIVVLSMFNYAVLTYIAPFWLDYATELVAVLGLPTTSASQTILWVLLLTGLYNFLHTALSMVPSVFITEAIINRMPNLAGNSWISQYRNKEQS
jgi:riboflavin transporter FmnP